MLQIKTCAQCAKVLSVSNFHARKLSSDGLHPRCKECRKVAERNYNAGRIKHIKKYKTGYKKTMKPLGLFSYEQARQRCNNPNHASYASYGGRGIEFKLTSFQGLLIAIGPRPKGFSIDRINPNGHYEIGNVRWAPMTIQNRNKRSSKITQVLMDQIKAMAKSGLIHREIAKASDISQASVSRIINEKQWFTEETRRVVD